MFRSLRSRRSGRVALVVAGLLRMSGSSYAQTLEIPTRASVLRLPEVRHITPEGHGCVKQVKGVLVLDARAQTLRFERGNRVGFEVPTPRIQAMHYEHTRGWPPRECGPRWPWRTAHLLTIHYSDAAGQSAAQSVRLPGDVPSVLAQLEAHTGLAVDQSIARGSFLGLPTHLAVGETLYVTDDTGQTTKAILTQLSVASLVVEATTPPTSQAGTRREFSAARVMKIEADDTLRNGAMNGVAAATLPTVLLTLYLAFDHNTKPWLPMLAGLSAGAGIGMAIDAAIKRDVYAAVINVSSNRARSGGATLLPLITRHSKGALVSVRF